MDSESESQAEGDVPEAVFDEEDASQLSTGGSGRRRGGPRRDPPALASRRGRKHQDPQRHSCADPRNGPGLLPNGRNHLGSEADDGLIPAATRSSSRTPRHRGLWKSPDFPRQCSDFPGNYRISRDSAPLSRDITRFPATALPCLGKSPDFPRQRSDVSGNRRISRDSAPMSRDIARFPATALRCRGTPADVPALRSAGTSRRPVSALRRPMSRVCGTVTARCSTRAAPPASSARLAAGRPGAGAGWLPDIEACDQSVLDPKDVHAPLLGRNTWPEEPLEYGSRGRFSGAHPGGPREEEEREEAGAGEGNGA
jgi:hypothetical protein